MMINSTQQSVDIAGIKDGVAIMRDGSYRMVLQTSPVNFALKSEQEQTSLIFQYQSFLNSLHFPIEIVVRSKRLDLAPYLKKINDIAKEQTNELIRIQATDYIDFVEKLINIANIMKKSFYVCVSYNPVTVRQVGLLDKLFGNKKEIYDHIKISDQEFKASTDKLRERANIIASGLGGMGLHCFQLSTEQLIELFYQIYNPDEATKERIGDMEALISPIIASENEINDENDSEMQRAAKESVIDNSNIVQEQRKHEAESRKQETEKTVDQEEEPAKLPAIGNTNQPVNNQQSATNTNQQVSPNNQTNQQEQANQISPEELPMNNQTKPATPQTAVDSIQKNYQ